MRVYSRQRTRNSHLFCHENYKVVGRKGGFTVEHSGMACDGIRAECDGDLAVEFNTAYHMNQSRTFAIKKFEGRESAKTLAGAWASRLQFMFNLAVARSWDLAIPITAEDLQGWDEPPAFAALAAAHPRNDKFGRVCHALRTLLPKTNSRCGRR